MAGRLLLHGDRVTDAARHRGWSTVAAYLCHVEPGLVSVDVFDTVLTRQVVGEPALWWVTAAALREAGCWEGSQEEFVTARGAAAAAVPAGTLEQIYEQPVLAGRCPPGAGLATEHHVETGLAVGVPGAAQALQDIRAAGHRVVFVSDMHVGQDHLWQVLRTHQLVADGDELVISSRVGASKSAGTLFPQLHRTGQLPSWHVGNDLWSDVAMAERAGVAALPVRLAEASRLEQVMADGTAPLASVLAGAARRVRMSSDALPPAEADLWETGADVAGQCLSAFLLWVRDQCEDDRTEQLLFLARDGELPLRMARAMPPDHWDGIELRYLEGSRRLWSVAAAAPMGVEAWLAAGTAGDAGFVRQKQHVIPWGSLLSRIALEPADLAEHAALRGLPVDQPLPRHLDSAWRELLADDRIRERLQVRAEQVYRDLRELLQDGSGVTRVAVVDVGWRGQMATHVSAVLRSIRQHEPVHLHFGGVDVAADSRTADIRRFAVDDSLRPLPFPDVISCVETFTASGAARARGIERDGNGAPRLVFDASLAHMDTPQRRLMWSSAVEVARSVPDRATLRRWGLLSQALDEPVRRVLWTFWSTPSTRHARAAAQLAAEVDDAGITVSRVARPYRVRDLLRRQSSPIRTWRQGSLRLTRPLLRTVLRHGLSLKTRHARSRARR